MAMANKITTLKEIVSKVVITTDFIIDFIFISDYVNIFI